MALILVRAHPSFETNPQGSSAGSIGHINGSYKSTKPLLNQRMTNCHQLYLPSHDIRIFEQMQNLPALERLDIKDNDLKTGITIQAIDS